MTARHQSLDVRIRCDRDRPRVNESRESSNQRSMPCGFVFAVRRLLGPPVTIERCFEGLTLKIEPQLFTLILKDKRLSLGAFKLWHLLYNMTGHNTHCWPSVRTLADVLAVDPKSVQKWVAELVECKYVRVEHGDRQHSNKYFVTETVKGVGKFPTRMGNNPTPVVKTTTQPVGINPTELNSVNQLQEENALKVQELIRQLKEAAR